MGPVSMGSCDHSFKNIYKFFVYHKLITDFLHIVILFKNEEIV